MNRTHSDLIALAGQYANERRVPAATIIKELLHYEILYALGQSGATSHLVFQGGTALRLCYAGTRYSEDLDFAGGANFDPESMGGFSELLHDEIAAAYGLHVEIKPPRPREPGSGGVHVARWAAKIEVPRTTPDQPQKQVINIEVASVPAHDVDLVAVTANYPHLPAALRQMLVPVETQREILADKIVALGARPFLKARDLWDIKFLTDRQIGLDLDLVKLKLLDYGLALDEFVACLERRAAELGAPDTAIAFHKEMSRFVDTAVASHLQNPILAAAYLGRAKEYAQAAIKGLSNHPGEPAPTDPTDPDDHPRR